MWKPGSRRVRNRPTWYWSRSRRITPSTGIPKSSKLIQLFSYARAAATGKTAEGSRRTPGKCQSAATRKWGRIRTPTRGGIRPQALRFRGEPTGTGGVSIFLCSPKPRSRSSCVFSISKAFEEERIRIRERTNGAWHIYIANLGPGQLYGYRVYGPYVPESGLRFNPNKLLLDPYAKAIGRPLSWADELFGYNAR